MAHQTCPSPKALQVNIEVEDQPSLTVAPASVPAYSAGVRRVSARPGTRSLRQPGAAHPQFVEGETGLVGGPPSFISPGQDCERHRPLLSGKDVVHGIN